jgi:hypothetical protein
MEICDIHIELDNNFDTDMFDFDDHNKFQDADQISYGVTV